MLCRISHGDGILLEKYIIHKMYAIYMDTIEYINMSNVCILSFI